MWYVMNYDFVNLQLLAHYSEITRWCLEKLFCEASVLISDLRKYTFLDVTCIIHSWFHHSMFYKPIKEIIIVIIWSVAMIQKCWKAFLKKVSNNDHGVSFLSMCYLSGIQKSNYSSLSTSALTHCQCIRNSCFYKKSGFTVQ